jgi:hypothetical protein
MRRAYRFGCVVAGAVACLCGAVAWQFGLPAWSRRDGAAQAVKDWNAGRARLFVRDRSAYDYRKWGLDFTHDYDRETGLRVVRRPIDELRTPWYDGYADGVVELLRRYGDPAWSARKYVLDDDELASYLKSPGLRRISEFPCHVTEEVVAVNGGEFSRWGCTTYGGGMRLVTRRYGKVELTAEPNQPLFVGRSRSHPRAVIIRVRNERVQVCDDQGLFISGVVSVHGF